MTFEEIERTLLATEMSMREASKMMKQAAERILMMNADWQEVLRLCRVENTSPADLERAIMQVGSIARKYYIP